MYLYNLKNILNYTYKSLTYHPLTTAWNPTLLATAFHSTRRWRNWTTDPPTLLEMRSTMTWLSSLLKFISFLYRSDGSRRCSPLRRSWLSLVRWVMGNLPLVMHCQRKFQEEVELSSHKTWRSQLGRVTKQWQLSSWWKSLSISTSWTLLGSMIHKNSEPTRNSSQTSLKPSSLTKTSSTKELQLSSSVSWSQRLVESRSQQ